MFKKVIKSCLASFLYSFKFKKTGSESGKGQPAGGSCLILMYHRVYPFDGSNGKKPEWLKIKSLPGIVVSPVFFDQQMRFLKEHYSIISLNTLVESMNQGRDIPSRSAVVTFDDGWRDNYEYAFPILKKHAVPATIFLSTGYIGTNRIFWPERLIYCLTYQSEQCRSNLQNTDWQGHDIIHNLFKRILSASDRDNHPLFNHLIEQLKQLKPDTRKKIIDSATAGISLDSDDMRVMMNWDEILEMSNAGIDFGSHGAEHEILTLLNPDEIAGELKTSKRTIVNKLSEKELAFAYPNGNYDDNIKKQVTDNGYICAVSTRTGKAAAASDRFALDRINIHQDNASGLSGKFSRTLFAYHIDLRF